MNAPRKCEPPRWRRGGSTGFDVAAPVVARTMGEAVSNGTISKNEALAMLTAVGQQVGLLDREILPTAHSGIRK